MNDLVVKNVRGHPGGHRPGVVAMAKNLHAPLSGWDNNTSGAAGLVPRCRDGEDWEGVDVGSPPSRDAGRGLRRRMIR